MNKKLFAMAAILIFTFLVAGCGEQEKYNSAKNDFVKIQEEWEAVTPANENIEKHNELAKKLDEKIKEMESLAKSETSLNNDLLDLKKKYKDKSNVWEGQLKEKNALAKQHKEVNAYGAAIDDPFATYGKAKK